MSLSPLPRSTEEIRAKVIAAAEAVYRLTEARDFDQALKFELRKKSSEVISGVAGFILNLGRKGDAAEELIADLAGAIELVYFAGSQGFIVPGNAARVAGAYGRIRDFVADSEIFQGSGEERKNAEEESGAPMHAPAAGPGEAPVGKSASYSEGVEIPPRTASAESPDERQEKILEYLKGKESVQIADIRAAFKDIGEKTLQRDLWHLVNC